MDKSESSSFRIDQTKNTNISSHVYPIRCFTCGKPFSNRITDQFETMVHKTIQHKHRMNNQRFSFQYAIGLSNAQWLTIGLTRICCRMVLLGTTERHIV